MLFCLYYIVWLTQHGIQINNWNIFTKTLFPVSGSYVNNVFISVWPKFKLTEYNLKNIISDVGNMDIWLRSTFRRQSLQFFHFVLDFRLISPEQAYVGNFKRAFRIKAKHFSVLPVKI